MSFFQVTRALPGNVVSALINFTAPIGLAVQFDPTKPSSFGEMTAEFKKASGTRGFFLEREVLTEIPLENSVFFKAYVTPEKVGNRVTARAAQEVIVEGLDLVQTSGTGAIAANTAVNTELSFNLGRLRQKQSGEEVVGWLREQITPEDAANITRIRVELAQ